MRQMNDTISREAVADAINGIECTRHTTWYEFYQKVLTAVEKLPPAEHGTNLAEVGTDCISRQAVLNEFCHSCDGWSCNPNTCCKTEWIRKLPVVQPERKECEEREQGKCPWYAG